MLAVDVGDCLSPAEVELARIVNEYRVQNGLTALPTSRWLSATGQWKIWDRDNNPSAVGGACNTHSWSSSPPAGIWWQGMCYTADHSQAAAMWAKPAEISVNRYAGNGFELAADAPGQTPANALLQWQNSPAHNAVILQTGVWSAITFGGLGVGMGANYAVLWFGDRVDTDVAMVPCDLDAVHNDGFEA